MIIDLGNRSSDCTAPRNHSIGPASAADRAVSSGVMEELPPARTDNGIEREAKDYLRRLILKKNRPH